MNKVESKGAADAETSGIGAAVAPGRERRMTAGRKRDAVLRLLRGEVVPLDPGVLTPGEDAMTGQLGSVVADHHARQPATFGDGA